MTFKQWIKKEYHNSDEELQRSFNYIQSDLLQEISNDENFPETNSWMRIYYYLRNTLEDCIMLSLMELYTQFLEYAIEHEKIKIKQKSHYECLKGKK